MNLVEGDIRDFDRLFYPVIPLIILAESNGVADAMVATWWTSVSYEPPRMAFAIAPERLTYKLIIEAGRFGVSAVSSEYARSLFFLGDFSGRFLKDKLARSGFTIIRGKSVGAPLIAESYAAAELELWRVLDVGDHDLIIGEVKAVYSHPSFNGIWRIEDSKPILYLGRLRERGLKRAYVSLDGAKTSVIESVYDESLESAREARRRLLEEIEKIVMESESLDEAKARALRLSTSMKLDERDIDYLIREASKKLATRSR